MPEAYAHINDQDNLRSIIAGAEKDLEDYLEYLKSKPQGVWMHRSTGTWARETILAAKKRLKELEKNA